MTGVRDPGLQAERTSLAWARTTFTLLAVAGLSAVRGCQAFTGPVGWLVAGVAVSIALVSWLISTRRQHHLRRCAANAESSVRREAHIVAGATLALSIVSTLALQI